MNTLINNSDWLMGYRARELGQPCPWGNESARLGWIAARDDESS